MKHFDRGMEVESSIRGYGVQTFGSIDTLFSHHVHIGTKFTPCSHHVPCTHLVHCGHHALQSWTSQQLHAVPQDAYQHLISSATSASTMRPPGPPGCIPNGLRRRADSGPQPEGVGLGGDELAHSGHGICRSAEDSPVRG